MGVGGCLQHPSQRVSMTPKKLFQEEELGKEEEVEDGKEEILEISDEEVIVISDDDEQ